MVREKNICLMSNVCRFDLSRPVDPQPKRALVSTKIAIVCKLEKGRIAFPSEKTQLEEVKHRVGSRHRISLIVI